MAQMRKNDDIIVADLEQEVGQLQQKIDLQKEENQKTLRKLNKHISQLNKQKNWLRQLSNQKEELERSVK